MESNEPERKEFTMGIAKANIVAIVLILPVLLIITLPFRLVWGYDRLSEGADRFVDYFLVYLIVGIVVHELLHGITWAQFASKGFKSIRFGMSWKFLTPYCHCMEPLKVKHYRVGGAMPLLLMGLLPAAIGLVTGNGFMLAFGSFFTIAALGDCIILFMLHELNDDVYVSDHPEKMGFIISNKPDTDEQ